MLIHLKNIGPTRTMQNAMVAPMQNPDLWPATFGTIECTAQIDNAAGDLHIELFYKCIIELECSRCLKSFSHALDDHFHLVCANAAKKEAPDDDYADFYFTEEDTVIDVGLALYDEIMLTLPMKPLCSQSCPGIAADIPGVTIEKNKPDKAVDARWQALKDLKDRMNKKI